MFRKFNPMTSENKTFSWWWFGIKVGVITALIVWWWLEEKNRQQHPTIKGQDSLDGSIPLPDDVPEMSGTTPEASDEAPPKSVETESAATISTEPDDLRKIEGIGPKIQATLKAAGIETFAQLTAFKPEDLKQILVDGGIRIGYPDTWPEQAALAAAGKWDELENLQSSLKGGRR
jgi:predicted flap endonuclease-1-like 5' DNA nuclease